MNQSFDVNRIHRSRHNKIITGLAGGLARHFDFEALYVRIAMVVGLLIAPTLVGVGYLVASLLIQER